MNIIVTGTSQGIGYEISKIFAGKSENTIIAVSRNDKKLKDLKDKCLAINPESKLVPIPFDLEKILSQPDNITRIILQHFNHIDILINNAGLLNNKLFMDTSYKEAMKTYNVNLFAPAILIKTLYPYMGKKAISHIVNISSMAGFQGSSKYPGLSYYSSSKAALASLTECLSREFKNSKIYVNCLALGSVQTKMFSTAFPDVKALLNPEQMAEFIADFSLNGHKYYRGKILPVSISNP